MMAALGGKDNPVFLANQKAKKLASLLQRQRAFEKVRVTVEEIARIITEAEASPSVRIPKREKGQAGPASRERGHLRHRGSRRPIGLGLPDCRPGPGSGSRRSPALTPQSFNLAPKCPTITVQAGGTTSGAATTSSRSPRSWPRNSGPGWQGRLHGSRCALFPTKPRRSSGQIWDRARARWIDEGATPGLKAEPTGVRFPPEHQPGRRGG
jgi:hypothetical protein